MAPRSLYNGGHLADLPLAGILWLLTFEQAKDSNSHSGEKESFTDVLQVRSPYACLRCALLANKQ
jgi:hypothetical protein